VGDGSGTLFCSDKWLHGKYVSDLAPLFGHVPKQIANRRIFRRHYHIRGGLPTAAFIEYLQLLDVL